MTAQGACMASSRAIGAERHFSLSFTDSLKCRYRCGLRPSLDLLLCPSGKPLKQHTLSPFPASKKLKLGGRLRCWLAFFSDIDLDPSELVVGDRQESDLALRRHNGAHSLHMHFRILD